ncbi:cis-golgi transport protein particle complex subunit [Xylariaceae sp. AK1471]|nr:cis-golgi transport protein particle complex subunit [Xylariaceae sp. AK1471]
MEQPNSTSKVTVLPTTVEYFDPHDVFKLLAPGLVPRLPLRNLHWQSHAGPLRSIETLHVELVPAGDSNPLTSPVSSPPPSQQRSENDGFQTQIGAALATTQSNETVDQSTHRNGIPARRHQIPGLRRTPYLKVLLVRCDDNDSYKSHVRQEIRDWIKVNTPPSTSKKANAAENHDAFEWLIVHVVIPNTVAATQPRKSDVGSGADKSTSASRWRPGSSTLLEKLRSDFNSSSKSGMDRVSQIRIGVNDVPYDILPRVVPAVPSGYAETEQETENAWTDLIAKFRSLILSSFDMRVTQYEEDIKEKDAQRSLPGWNFCTFFILKEGLARGFESVGLVEDALVGYDELSVGLDMIIKDQSLGRSGSAANALPAYTEELKKLALKARATILETNYDEDDELVDLQSSQSASTQTKDSYDDIPISSSKKPYRDLIVANNVSVFDFRCYIFARQIALLLRLGNAWSTREELLAKLREQQESILHDTPKTTEGVDADAAGPVDSITSEVVDNLVVSFAFSTAQQILAQTSTKALPIPSSSLGPPDGHEPKAAIPEPKTMMHPARSSSLNVRTGGAGVPRPPLSPNVFPGGRLQSVSDHEGASSRAELYTFQGNILEESGKKRGWSNGWSHVPVHIDLGGEDVIPAQQVANPLISMSGIESKLLKTALDNNEDFYRLYEILTDKALRHYTVAGHTHSIQSTMADLARMEPFRVSMLIMYSKCLKQLQRKDEYVKVTTRRQAKPFFKNQAKDYPESEAISGFLDDLLLETRTLSNEMRVPLSNFVSSIEVVGTPEYDEGRDSLTIQVMLNSLLVDDLTIDTASVRIATTSSKPSKEIGNALIPGSYEIDKIDLRAGKLIDRADLLKSPKVFVYHRADTLDVRLYPSKHIQLDRNNSVEVELDTGWNNLHNAEIRVKAATGGLRLLTSEAKCLHASLEFSRPPEGGVFWFNSIPPKTAIRIRFPYTLEQESPSISLRIEVLYETEHGSYVFSKIPTVHTGLALGVNVQDVFKHSALFSRFTVSTASSRSNMFESTFGVPSSNRVMIFPRQPGSLLYKIKRKVGIKNGLKTPKTMYLKLHYSVLRDEIEALIESSLVKALHSTPLRPLSRLVLSSVLPLARNDLTGIELERAALLGFIPTSFLARVDYPRIFNGLGKDETGVDLSENLASFLRTWQAENPTLVFPTSEPAEPSSILIPVDIPSVTIVHTADIRLQPPPAASTHSAPGSITPTVCSHQLLPATLHLKWTRMWDTVTPPSEQADLEFSYELSAPQDTWLFGGRRKGHFVIPAPASDDERERSSSVDTEAEIPILLIPLREGWLPYPSVEIREVRPSDSVDRSPATAGTGGHGDVHYETDLRNLGETVRVVADRTRVTLSLDASGPGGGPLVLDVEKPDIEGRVLVA